MGVVSSAGAAKLAEIRPRVSHPDRQQEDSLFSSKHCQGRGRGHSFLSLSSDPALVPAAKGSGLLELLGFTCHTCYCSYGSSHIHFVICTS